MARLNKNQFGKGMIYGIDRGDGGARLTRVETEEEGPKRTGGVSAGNPLLQPGFLGNLPSFKDVVNKMTVKTADLSNISDASLLAMYQGGFYSHPAFGEMPHFDRAAAVKQELAGRRVLEELSEKDRGREDAFQSRGRAIREENKMVDGE